MSYPKTIEERKEKEATINAYFDGQRDGLELYAWWKDGTQWVGSCGTTLAKALDDCERKRKESLEALCVLHY